MGLGSRHSGEPVDPYKDHTVEQMDVLIAEITTQINQLNLKVKHIEKDPYATKTTIKAKAKPLNEEKDRLRFSLMELNQIRDAKIPDHEKLPKDCTFAKHYLQVAMNEKI